MARHSLWTLMAISAGLTAVLSAQDDLRDRVTLSNGKVIEGRVVARHQRDQLLIVQGGQRIRVPVAQVASTSLVPDKLSEFFKRRHQHQRSRRALRYLVDWANTAQLPDMARLLAMELVLQDDTDEKMHLFLGHRQRNRQWLWQHDGKWQTLNKIEESMLDQPLRLHGERFSLRCDAGLLTNVRALLDLEQLGVTWFEQFGPALGLKEVLQPIEIRTFRNVSEFPKWGFRPRPYFEPPPHADLGRTFYAGPAPDRPEDLFFVGTQGLLYRTLIGEVDQRDRRDRVCAWLEIGLGKHMQNIMQGPAGFAAPAKPKQLDLQAMQALGRDYRLTHLLRLPMYGGFYLTDDSATAINWSAATMLVTWLLEKANKGGHRTTFMQYIRTALADRQGDSSSAFDRVMGKPIELFDEPWRVWLNEVVGN